MLSMESHQLSEMSLKHFEDASYCTSVHSETSEEQHQQTDQTSSASTQIPPIDTSASSGSKCFLDRLSDELIHSVLVLLTPPDLLACFSVNKRFSGLCFLHDEDLWTKHITSAWAKSGWTKATPNEVCLTARIQQQLSMLQLKRTLQRVDTGRCLEKQDFQRMCASFLLFGLRGVTPPSTVKRSLKTYLPQWSLEMGKFKQSYFFALKELRRTNELTKTELCMIHWKFYFKNEMEHESRFMSRFNDDNTMTSDMHDNIMAWDWYEVEGQPRCVRVEQYPPLRATRLPDGLWRMENMYVYFLQEEPLDPDNIPLL